MINWQDRIHSNPEVLLGKPVIKGTRLSVEFLLKRLANGWTTQDLLVNYPSLKQEDVQALFAYTLEVVSCESPDSELENSDFSKGKNRTEILSLAGSWSDMSEEDFADFLEISGIKE